MRAPRNEDIGQQAREPGVTSLQKRVLAERGGVGQVD